MLSGSTLYGITLDGGSNSCGTVFKLNTDGSGYTVLKDLTFSGGCWPTGLALSNGILYGTAYQGGDFDNGNYNGGTVFKLGTDGSGYTVLHSFNGSTEGCSPGSAPVLSGNTLYGTTENGYGHTTGGTVYSINTDGSGFSELHAFPPSGMYGIVAPLVISGTTLYGTDIWGGSFGDGTVFRLNTDGTGFTVLKNFDGGGDGGMLQAGLLLCATTLYGTALYGGDQPYGPGTSGHGTVFRVNTDGSGFMVLKLFSGSDDGAGPEGLVASGTTLFGTAAGGSANYGVIFSLSVAPPTIVTPPESQTAEAGSETGFRVQASGPSLSYLWFFNSTNLVICSTNCQMELTNVQFPQSGAYTVVVSNVLGATTSSPAMLNVIAPVERRPVPGVKLIAPVGTFWSLDYRDNLGPTANWETMATMSLTNASQFCFDLSAPLPAQRFYRAWQSGTPSVRPSLDLHRVPAITLTGTVGHSVRLDYINQFGPTDAWVTLDTVTMTNTSQLYFDTSAPGQPQRLYRLVQVP